MLTYKRITMATFRKIKDITTWKESIDLTLYVYELIKESETFQKDYGLKDQIQRSAVSIPSNISEGFERETAAEFIRSLYIAKGSCGELRTQLLIAYKLGYIKEEDFQYYRGRAKTRSTKGGASPTYRKGDSR